MRKALQCKEEKSCKNKIISRYILELTNQNSILNRFGLSMGTLRDIHYLLRSSLEEQSLFDGQARISCTANLPLKKSQCSPPKDIKGQYFKNKHNTHQFHMRQKRYLY